MKNNVHRLLCSKSEKEGCYYNRRYSQTCYENNKNAEMGVSASHLDWTMVPYVRKSFYKHFKDGLHYIEDPVGDKYLSNVTQDMSIDNKAYKETYHYAYTYAMDMTERELEQAVEGLFHNLNTLQSRSGN